MINYQVRFLIIDHFTIHNSNVSFGQKSCFSAFYVVTFAGKYIYPILIVMKTIQLSLATLCLLFIAAISNTGNAQSNLSSWTALTDFHKVMSQTFHPSEEGNLEPIKTRIGEMVEKAEALKSSEIPADFNTKKVKKAVKKLVTDSKKLQSSIKAGASDEQIKASLSSLHDVFHQIVGLCSANEEHDHDHGHDHNHE